MAVRVRVQNRFQIIVPLRIGRAVRGAPVLDAPDVDDRGWVNNRAAGLNVIDVRGSVFGILLGETIRLRVVREDLDDTAPLFVTSTGNQIRLVAPLNAALPASGEFRVRGIADTTQGSKVEVRLGSATGPILGEADAHVFSPRTLNITPHVCTVHAAATAGGGTGVAPTVNGAAMDAAMITSIFDLVHAFWRPAGVRFNVGAVRQETFVGFTRDDSASLTAPAGGGQSEVARVLDRNSVPNTCNLFFLRFLERILGIGIRFENQGVVGSTRSGLLVAAEGSTTGATVNTRSSTGAALLQELGNDVAHEIGHFLTLPHAGNVNNAGLPDTYGRRHLMHPQNLLPRAVTPLTATSVPRFNDIGYGVGGNGRGHRGGLLTLKDDPLHSSDGEVVDARRRFLSPNLVR